MPGKTAADIDMEIEALKREVAHLKTATEEIRAERGRVDAVLTRFIDQTKPIVDWADRLRVGNGEPSLAVQLERIRSRQRTMWGALTFTAGAVVLMLLRIIEQVLM